jgi:SlyX protein
MRRRISNNTLMNPDTIERFELKIAYLERANHDLSEVVYRQQQQLDALRAQLTALSGKMAAALSEQTVYSAEQERPPHY